MNHKLRIINWVLVSRILGVGKTGWDELLEDYNNSKCVLNRDRSCTIEGFCLRCGVNEFFFELTGWIFLVASRAVHHYIHLTKLKTPIAIRNLVLAKLQFEGVVLLFPVLLWLLLQSSARCNCENLGSKSSGHLHVCSKYHCGST